MITLSWKIQNWIYAIIMSVYIIITPQIQKEIGKMLISFVFWIFVWCPLLFIFLYFIKFPHWIYITFIMERVFLWGGSYMWSHPHVPFCFFKKILNKSLQSFKKFCLWQRIQICKNTISIIHLFSNMYGYYCTMSNILLSRKVWL